MRPLASIYVTQVTLRALCLAYRQLWTMSVVVDSSDPQQVPVMSPTYDHRQWRIVRSDVTGTWIILASMAIAVVLSLL